MAEEGRDRRNVIRVSNDTDTAVREYAATKKLQIGEAADKLIALALSRRNSWTKYAKNASKKEKE